jgi:hypothetical protein
MSYAALYREQGNNTEAVEILAPIYDWFSEGYESGDLSAARSLLAELAPG